MKLMFIFSQYITVNNSPAFVGFSTRNLAPQHQYDISTFLGQKFQDRNPFFATQMAYWKVDPETNERKVRTFLVAVDVDNPKSFCIDLTEDEFLSAHVISDNMEPLGTVSDLRSHFNWSK